VPWVFSFPLKPIAIRDPELGHLAGTQKRNSPIKGIPQEPSLLGDLRNGDDVSQENGTEFLGNGEFPGTGVQKKGEPEKGMHSLVPSAHGVDTAAHHRER
jgi:hypothetical protein